MTPATIINFNLPVVSFFPKIVNSFPHNNALFINNKYYTYSDLWKIVFSIYNKIPSQKPFERIGVFCNDDVTTYACSIAIGLYGAAYIPLNSKFPIARNKNIVEQCNLKLILSTSSIYDFKELTDDIDVVILESHSAIDYSSSPEISMSLSEIKYQKVNQPYSCILFTSGTTGEPKGVPLTHQNLNHFFNYQITHYDFNESDKFLQVYELTFDVSIFSFLMPLMVGGCCYAVPDTGLKFTTIIQMLKIFEITVVSMVPTILAYIKNYLHQIHLPRLRYSIFSGDALDHNLASLWAQTMPNGAIHNFCGPTETTIVCMRYPFNIVQSKEESVNGIVPIGKPLPGIDILILNEFNLPDEKGELCYSGNQIITHYLDNKNLNKFISIEDKIWYRSGDLVEKNQKGNLCFLGRTDSQVKVNGFRIELSEIEFAIKKITNKNVVVVQKKNKNNINQLFAFIENDKPDGLNLKERLATLLPEYMIPSKVISIEKFPLNINEKIDRSQLLNFANAE